MNIPIVVIAYNRPNSLERLLNSLNLAEYENDKIDLIISIDKSDCLNVNKVAENFNWKYGSKNIINNKENLGLKEHVLKVGDIVVNYDAIIMLEDDLVVSKSFYKYAVQSVSFYKNDKNIAGISLYTYGISEFADYRTFIPMQDDADTFFMKVPSSWGQIWTKEQWLLFRNWYNDNKHNSIDSHGMIPKVALSWNENSSWKKFFFMYIALHNKYIVYPRVALSTNMSENGTHHKLKSTAHQSILMGNFKRDYLFKSFSESICKYDAFFEYADMGRILNLKNKAIAVDYYGIKKEFNNCTYLLTTRILDLKILKKWGLSLKPYELNIIYDIDGSDLFLYELGTNRKNSISTNIIKLIKYELPGITKEKSLKIAYSEYKAAVKRKIKKVISND